MKFKGVVVINPLDEETIRQNTYFSNQTYRRMKKNIEAYETDLKKPSRLRSHECKTCFYLKTSLAGQAFTPYQCKNCGETNMHPNTATPRYCDQCAKKFGICKFCGGLINE